LVSELKMSSEPKLPLNLDVPAKAEASLKVEATIPEASTGRVIDALVDIIRPFSERRGLQADNIRLQREEVAIKVAQLAVQRIAIERAQINPIPTKLLVPILENASNEDADDTEMQSRWANLLASAATKTNIQPRYMGILKELQGKQANLLDQIARNNAVTFDRPLAHLTDSPFFLEPIWAKRTVRSIFSADDFERDANFIHSEIVDWLDRPGCALIDIITFIDDEMFSLSDTDKTSEAERDLDLGILESLGLLSRYNDVFELDDCLDVQIIYFYITELGVRFFFAVNNLEIEPIPK